MEELGLNPRPSDHETDTLTAWLKPQAASQAATYTDRNITNNNNNNNNNRPGANKV